MTYTRLTNATTWTNHKYEAGSYRLTASVDNGNGWDVYHWSIVRCSELAQWDVARDGDDRNAIITTQDTKREAIEMVKAKFAGTKSDRRWVLRTTVTWPDATEIEAKQLRVEATAKLIAESGELNAPTVPGLRRKPAAGPRLVFVDSGVEVSVGDTVTDRDGDEGTVEYFRPPTSAASEGKIVVDGFELYVSCWNLKWINRTDRPAQSYDVCSKCDRVGHVAANCKGAWQR